jgi:ComF family protein
MNPINRLLSYIAPLTCEGCGREGTALCMECSEMIDTLPNICYACGRASRSALPCDTCKLSHSPQHVWVYAEYKDLLKRLIYGYKFEYKRDTAPVFGQIIDEALPYFAEPPYVTFVPTADSHRRERGFDHAELIAKELAQLRGWRYGRTLVRTRTARQLGASRADRKMQIKGAFRPTGSVTDKHILLIDDVLTTGATIEECTRILKAAGARAVDAVVAARTPNKNT